MDLRRAFFVGYMCGAAGFCGKWGGSERRVSFLNAVPALIGGIFCRLNLFYFRNIA